MRRLCAIASIAAAASCFTSLARADAPKPATVRASLSEAAREAFDRGASLHAAARYAEARDAFLAAHARSGDARVLYNVAVCDKSLGRYARAISVLRKSLATSASPLPSDYVRRVEENIEILSRYVGIVDLTTSPPGAAVTVDGEPAAGQNLALDTGDHVVVVSQEGFESKTVTLSVRAGDRRAEVISLVRAATPGAVVLRCAKDPRCTFRVGDAELGAGPAAFAGEAGIYVASAWVDGRRVAEQSFELVNGKRSELVLLDRTPASARLRVVTGDQDDTVTVGGRVSRAGAMIELPAGEHQVLIRGRAGASKTMDLVLRENETRDLRLSLDRSDERRGISAWWFVGGGAVVGVGAVVAAVLVANQPTQFRGDVAGTLNPGVVPASFGGFR